VGELSFRDARAEDVAALVALVNYAFRAEEFFVPGPRTTAAEVGEQLRSGSFLVVEERGRPVGCVYVGRRGERGYFGLLSVDPREQGRGLGRRLVLAAEERLRAQGHREVEILVVDLRKDLDSFYLGMGYRVSGEAPFPDSLETRIPCRFLVMSKSLA
jgi:GNAT superfamily N-acetyltransferase